VLAAVGLSAALAMGGAAAVRDGTPRQHGPGTRSALVGVHPQGTGTTTTTVAVSPPPNCPSATHPPGTPYQVALTTTLTAKLTIVGLVTTQTMPAVMPHISSDLCSLLLLPGETSTVLPADTTFANPTLINIPTGAKTPPIEHDYVDLSLAAPSIATVSPTLAANGGLNISITAQVQTLAYEGTPGPQAPACEDGPVSVTLTTDAPGGQPLSGPLQNATATLVASGFTIPASTDTSTRCGIFGGQINYLLNLPNDHTTMVVHVHLSVSD
jgi:hypothetical protein